MSEVNSSVVARQLDVLRSTREYQYLLSTVKNVIDADNAVNSDQLMTDVADTVLRTIASDLSSVSSENKIIIMHMAITPKVEGGKNAFNRLKTRNGMSRRG
jgi:hypothetical protein